MPLIFLWNDYCLISATYVEMYTRIMSQRSAPEAQIFHGMPYRDGINEPHTV